MKSIQQLAEEGFEKAAEIINLHQPEWDKCKQWSKLPEHVKTAWIAATRHIVEKSKEVH